MENLVKRSKSNYLTPPPQVTGLEQLAGLLFDGCQRDLQRVDRGQSRSRQQLLQEEKQRMLPLPPQRFLACRQHSSHASKQALVRFEDNDYSVPAHLACRPCLLQAFVQEVVILFGHQEVARHERCYQRGQHILEPRHYLGLLQQKPGALDNALAFKSLLKDQDLQLLRSELRYRHGQAGDRQFITILQLLKDHPPQALAAAVAQCVRQRLFAPEAIRQVLRGDEPTPLRPVLELQDRADLQVQTRGLRSLQAYGQLLSSAGSHATAQEVGS